MKSDEPRFVAQRWFEEVWNDRDEEAIFRLLAPDARGHVEGGELRGPQAYVRMHTMYLFAIPDMEVEIEDIVSEGDRAVVRWRATGTHGGDGFGFPPTNRRIDARGTSWMVIRNGKIVEWWDTWNFGGLLERLR
jgi:steroid delta-isomerase-like uncharacterized protein